MSKSKDPVWAYMECVWRRDVAGAAAAFEQIEDVDEAIQIVAAWGVAMVGTLANTIGSDPDRLWKMLMESARRTYGRHKDAG